VAAPVVLLSGGTGGAKLARGLLDEVGEDLVVVANTADDIEIYGAHVSPDPDLVTFWLADRIDERGWGLEGDTFAVMDGLREIGEEVWFNLGDRDLAIGVQRARRMAGGERLTTCLLDLGKAFGVPARVLPMSDAPVRTRVRGGGRWWPLQEWLIRGGEAAGPVEEVYFEGSDAAFVTQEVFQAIGSARAIVIGPSNPVISVSPILALPGMRRALQAAAAQVVAVSPIVGGEVLKGPTAAFMAAWGLSVDTAGVAKAYEGLLDGLVADATADVGIPVLEADTLMDTAEARRRVAAEVLGFAATLGD
jgi:LPPG:FO 2-phospho-L-lactate transferase